MGEDHVLSFGLYRFDLEREQLWRKSQIVKMAPKALALLQYLVERPGKLVTKDELFQAVWPETVVSDAALTWCMKELRKVLQDDPRKPRYIETVYRRGFRFIGTVNRQSGGESQQKQETSRRLPIPHFVGRTAELAQLRGWLEEARAGERHIVFVTGEAGIGKTTLVNRFLEEIAQASTANGQLWIGHGQCVEQYGAGEAYMPVLEALGRLGRMAQGKSIVEVLRQYAPTWLVQLPALLSGTERQQLQREVGGATPERMLREIAEALEALTVERTLVIPLEDLHWSDTSTIELLAVLARRNERARLLVLVTYRPVDVLLRENPLRGVKQELQWHGQCKELALDFLTEEAVAAYLSQRFSSPSLASVGAGFPPANLHKFAQFIHQRTDGNPLFMVAGVDALVRREVLARGDGGQARLKKLEELEVAIPESLQQLIEQQIERVSPEEREILEAASVTGAEFSAAAVAAGVEQETEVVEGICDALVRRGQFLWAIGTDEWPDRTVAIRYGFIHGLYQEVLYGRVAGARRVRLHQRIGVRVEAGYAERASEIATELAVHFERGRDLQRAVHYLQQAGLTAMQRSAYAEAIMHLSHGLELLPTLQATPERAQQELALQTALGPALVATKGFGAPEVEHAYARARELCQQQRENPQLFRVLWGLWVFYIGRAELQIARELAQQQLHLAERLKTPASLMLAHGVLGTSLLWGGELVAARSHLEQSVRLYDPHRDDPRVSRSVIDHKVAYLSFYVPVVLWLLGYPDQAAQQHQDALSFAKKLSHPFSLAWAYTATAWIYLWRREERVAQEAVDTLPALTNEQAFPYLVADGTILGGAVLAEQGQTGEGLTMIRQGLDARQATGTIVLRTRLLTVLAEAYGAAGKAGQGLSVLAEALALVDTTGERFYEAELYRLKGELLLNVERKNRPTKRRAQNAKSVHRSSFTIHRSQEAEACFQTALDVSRQQQARALELRAATSLARLWQQQGKKTAAHAMLAKIYGWFTEGFDTKDLQEAKAVLKELER